MNENKLYINENAESVDVKTDVIESVKIPVLKKYFSTISGEIYTVEEDEEKNLDLYQIPLIKSFPRSCKKCFGRGYVGKHFSKKDEKAEYIRKTICFKQSTIDKIEKLAKKDGDRKFSPWVALRMDELVNDK